jgi:hypothetical protein
MSIPTPRSARPPGPRDGQDARPRGQVRPRAGPSITPQGSNPNTARPSPRHQAMSMMPRRVIPAWGLTAPRSKRSASRPRRLARKQARSTEAKPRPATTRAPTSRCTTCRAKEVPRTATRPTPRRLPPSAIRTLPTDTRRPPRHAQATGLLPGTLLPSPSKAPVRSATTPDSRLWRAACRARRSRADRRRMTMAETPTQPPRLASRIHPPETVPARRSTRCLGANQRCR